jgi:rhodanese-related sulfurtransferase
MPTFIYRERVLELQAQGAPIIDVLPPREHDEMRLAGSIGIWLRQLDASADEKLSKTDPIFVYCHDYL